MKLVKMEILSLKGGIRMVKGISRQVIVVQSPDKDLFDQAIFILRDDAVGSKGVTDARLLQEAKRLVGSASEKKKLWLPPLLWAFAGAAVTGAFWLISALF